MTLHNYRNYIRYDNYLRCQMMAITAVYFLSYSAK